MVPVETALKHLWSFLYKSLKFYLKRVSATGVSYLGKDLKMNDFWQLETFTFDVFQFLTTAISFSCYYLFINVNKKLRQIALLEHTPYRMNMPVSFLEDLTQIIFNDSLKYNQQLTSTVD